MKVLLCEVNISEGKNLETIEEVKKVIEKSIKIKIIDIDSDKNHNRTVYTYMGEPQEILEATKMLADKAIELIDMSKHHGSHPRIGAVDVVPFIPVKDIETEEAIKITRKFGKYIGSRGIPVYYYEDAATCPKRKSLVEIRRGQYEGLKEKLKDPEWTPDEGPTKFVSKTGAVITGVRFPLVAFNVNLRTNNLEIANNIVRSVRHINGGYRFVRAIGLNLTDKNMVQVSMNLTNYTKTPIHRVMETVRSEASRYGISIAGAELVGPVPMKAIEEIVKFYLQTHNFSINQIIENNLLDLLDRD